MQLDCISAIGAPGRMVGAPGRMVGAPGRMQSTCINAGTSLRREALGP